MVVVALKIKENKNDGHTILAHHIHTHTHTREMFECVTIIIIEYIFRMKKIIRLFH